MRFVPIVDAGFAHREDYPAYVDGASKDVFIRSAANHSEPFIGKVWPGDASFPDFLHEGTSAWW